MACTVLLTGVQAGQLSAPASFLCAAEPVTCVGSVCMMTTFIPVSDTTFSATLAITVAGNPASFSDAAAFALGFEHGLGLLPVLGIILAVTGIRVLLK